jgi:hypothetical protein
MKVDGAASALNFKELNIFNIWFIYNNQTWLEKAPNFDGPFFQFFIQHPTWVLRYWELFYFNSLNYWSDFGQYLASTFNLVNFENYEPNFQVMGFFGETEKPFFLSMDPFSGYILLADFTDYFFNVIYDLYFVLKYELNLSEKSYGSLIFKDYPVVMAANSDSQNSTSDESASDSELFRKKLKRYLVDKSVELIDPYPICRRNPDTDSILDLSFLTV